MISNLETKSASFLEVKTLIIENNIVLERLDQKSKKLITAYHFGKHFKSEYEKKQSELSKVNFDFERLRFQYGLLKPEYLRAKAEVEDLKAANAKLTELYQEAIADYKSIKAKNKLDYRPCINNCKTCSSTPESQSGRKNSKNKELKMKDENFLQEENHVKTVETDFLEKQILELESKLISVQLLAEQRKKQIDELLVKEKLTMDTIQLLKNDNFTLTLKNEHLENLQQKKITFNKSVQTINEYNELPKLNESTIEKKDMAVQVFQFEILNHLRPEDIDDPLVADILRRTQLHDSVFDRRGHPPNKIFTIDDFRPVQPLSDDDDDDVNVEMTSFQGTNEILKLNDYFNINGNIEELMDQEEIKDNGLLNNIITVIANKSIEEIFIEDELTAINEQRRQRIISKAFITNSSSESSHGAATPTDYLYSENDSLLLENLNCNWRNSKTERIQDSTRQEMIDIVLPNIDKSINNGFEITTKKSDDKMISKNDLFGSISSSSDNEIEQECVKHVSKPLKISRKSTLKSRVIQQLNGKINKIVNASDSMVKTTGNNNNKINIIQDIVIAKARKPIPDSLKIVKNLNEGTSINKNREANLHDSINKPRNINKLIISSTPVNILTQVMNGMDKNKLKEEYSPYPSIEKTEIEATIIQENFNPNESISYPESPASPEPEETLINSHAPVIIPTCSPIKSEAKPSKISPYKLKALLNKVMVFASDPKVLDEVIEEFALHDQKYISKILIQKLLADALEKRGSADASDQALTTTQKVILGLISKLNKSVPGSNIYNEICDLIEHRLFFKAEKKPSLKNIVSITRFYTAICKLNKNVNRIRKFICEAFYFMEDLAIPVFFTALTLWSEMWPMYAEKSMPLLAKTIVQVCYLKVSIKAGYNLLPLRELLHKYYGYPSERWICQHLFDELLRDFTNKPTVLSEYSLLIFLRNKPSTWVMNQVNKSIVPYYNYSCQEKNVKMAVMILLTKIYSGLKPNDIGVLLEMKKLIYNLSNTPMETGNSAQSV